MAFATKASLSGVNARSLERFRGQRSAKQMLSCPWFQRKEWQREIEHMMKTGVKLEIESLSNRGISFISEEYLPRKLKQKDWLA